MQEMHDSGKREQFGDGATRDTAEGKPDFSLLSPWLWPLVHREYGNYVRDFLISADPKPMQDLMKAMLEDMGFDRLLEWLRQGSIKYSRFNWCLGMPITRCLASLGRHLRAMTDSRCDEDHGAAAMCNVMFICDYLMQIERGLLTRNHMDIFDYSRGLAAPVPGSEVTPDEAPRSKGTYNLIPDDAQVPYTNDSRAYEKWREYLEKTEKAARFQT